MPQSTKPTILLIEADASLRRLIVLGLQYRGMNVVEAPSPIHLPFIETEEQPSLLVLDVDGRMKSNWSLLTAVETHPLLSTLPIIVLAWDCPVPALIAGNIRGTEQTQVTYLAKPFDARALYTTIEQLLVSQAMYAVQATHTTHATHAIQSIKEVPQLSATQIAALSPAPSIFPLITAAGLLLAFIGLMGFFVLTLLGIAVVLISLLAWTLGTGRSRQPNPLPVGIGNS